MHTILYIEDDPLFARIISDVLGNAGHSVLIAKDGEEGLLVLRDKVFDLVLLDLLLPKIDGFEVFRKLRENPKTKRIPVVILSNLDAKEDMEQAERLGAAHYFVKALTEPSDVVSYIGKLFGTKGTAA